MSTVLQWPGSSTERELKSGSMFFADKLWSEIAQVLRLKMIPNLLETNSTHTGIAYAGQTCLTHLWLHGQCMRHRACCKIQQISQWLLGLEHAKFAFHKKYNNCPHHYPIFSAVRMKTRTTAQKTSSGFTDGIQILTFNQSFMETKWHSITAIKSTPWRRSNL